MVVLHRGIEWMRSGRTVSKKAGLRVSIVEGSCVRMLAIWKGLER